MISNFLFEKNTTESIVDSFFYKVATDLLEISSSFSEFFSGFWKAVKSIYSIKLSFNQTTLLKGIKSFKRYCKATLNMFLFLICDDDKIIYLQDRFCVK